MPTSRKIVPKPEPELPKLSSDSDKLGLLAASALAFVVMALCFYTDVSFPMVVYRVAVTFTVTYFGVHLLVRLAHHVASVEAAQLGEEETAAEAEEETEATEESVGEDE